MEPSNKNKQFNDGLENSDFTTMALFRHLWLLVVASSVIGFLAFAVSDKNTKKERAPRSYAQTYSQAKKNREAAAVASEKFMVVGVTDGDTVTVLSSNKEQIKIRLLGIDAPESHQAFGQKSKAALSDLVYLKLVELRGSEKDRYGRTLSHIYVGGNWVNREMLKKGLAWHYKKYSSDEQLAATERLAKVGKHGLWTDANPIAPWDFRRGGSATSSKTTPDREADAPPRPRTDFTAARVYVTQTGSKFHRGNCRYLRTSKRAISKTNARQRYSPCSVCRP